MTAPPITDAPSTSDRDEPTTRVGDRGALWVILRQIRNQPVRYACSLTVWISIWTLPILVGVIAQRYFDGLTDQPGGWSAGGAATALLAWTAAYVAAIVTGMRVHASLMVRQRSSVMQAMLAWVFGLPAGRPIAESSGEVVSRFRDDTEHLQEAFDFSVDLVGSGLSAVIAFTLLAWVDPVLTIVVFVPIVLVVVLVWSLGARIRRYRVAARETTEEVTGFLGETFGAAAAVKVAGAEQAVLGRLGQLNDRRRRMMVRDRTLTATTDALVNNTADVAVGIVLLLAAGTIGGGAAGLSVGDVALFTLLLGRVTFAAYMTGQFLARLRQAGVSVERMVGLLPGAEAADVAAHTDLDTPTPGLPELARSDVQGAPLLALRGATVTHPGGGVGIEEVDLTIEPGQLVVVTGRVGSGKTTLLRAALGLLPLDDGTITWRGSSLEDPAAVLVPPRTAYTPQVPRLFSMDLRDNLAMGMPVDDEHLDDAMRSATLDVDLDAMPNGLDTLIGPRGLRLSGGQVQRAAAARMLARHPELLVFDDLSSALDVETEARLWDNLFAPGGLPGRAGPTTALVVSHRRPALRRADLVVVLEGGRIVDAGTATELLERSAAFRGLWGDDAGSGLPVGDGPGAGNEHRGT